MCLSNMLLWHYDLWPEFNSQVSKIIFLSVDSEIRGIILNISLFRYQRLETANPENARVSDKCEYILIISQGLINGAIIYTTYQAVLNAPLGDAMAVIFSTPIFSLVLSAIFLRDADKFTVSKLIAALSVVIGVALIVKPPFLFPDNNDNK